MTFKSLWRYVHIVIAAGFLRFVILVLAVTPFRFMGNEVLSDIAPCILGVVASTVLCFFWLKKSGYDDGSAEKPLLDVYTIIRICFATGIYLLLVVILRYAMFGVDASVLAHYLGGIDRDVGISEMGRDHGGMMFLSLLILTLPCIPAMIGGYVWGRWVRRREKAAFRRSEQQK